jgi:hypothetical protein
MFSGYETWNFNSYFETIVGINLEKINMLMMAEHKMDTAWSLSFN